LNSAGWEKVFNTALKFGWEPLGTRATDIEEEMHGVGEEGRRRILVDQSATWNGSYFGNYYQEITSDDAVALAAALKRALLFPDQHEGEEVDVPDDRLLVDAIEFFHQGRCYIG